MSDYTPTQADWDEFSAWRAWYQFEFCPLNPLTFAPKKGMFSDELFWSELQAYPDLDAETMLSLLHQYRDEFLATR